MLIDTINPKGYNNRAGYVHSKSINRPGNCNFALKEIFWISSNIIMVRLTGYGYDSKPHQWITYYTGSTWTNWYETGKQKNVVSFTTSGITNGVKYSYWSNGSTVTVEVEGGLTASISSWGVLNLGTLPASCRPPMNLVFPIANSNNQASIYIGTNGVVQVSNRSGNTFYANEDTYGVREIFTVCTFTLV